MSTTNETMSVLYVHGGSAFSKHEQFLERLRTRPIDDPREVSERQKRWADSLSDDLGADFAVIAPSMPNKQNAKYEEWKVWFERYFAFLESDVVLVGWSQGGYFLAKYLTENVAPFKIRALFLIAAPVKPEDFGGEDGGDFKFDTRKLPQLATQAERIHVLHSKDDPLVPFTHAEMYKEALPEAKLHAFDGRGHFLMEEFPELIELIKHVRMRPDAAGGQ